MSKKWGYIALFAMSVELAICGTGHAGSTPGPSPYGVVIAGENILAVGNDGHLWHRSKAQSAAWQMSEVGNSTDYQIDSLICTTDNSGICAVAVWMNGRNLIFLYEPGANNLSAVSILNGFSLQAFSDKQNLYVTRLTESGSIAVYNSDPKSNKITEIGTMGTKEKLLVLPVSGRQIPFSYGKGTFHPISATDKALAFDLKLPEAVLWAGDGLLLPESWILDTPIKTDSRALTRVRFATGSKGIEIHNDLVSTFPIDGAILPDYSSAGVDKGGDIVGAAVGPNVHAVGFFCQLDVNQAGFTAIRPLQGDETATIVASQSGKGFLVEVNSLSQSPQYELVELPERQAGRARMCSDRPTFTDIAIPVEANLDRFVIIRTETVSQDGTKIPYYVLQPKGGDPDHVIIDVYGAYGTVRKFPYYGRTTLQKLTDTKTAVVFPVVRGDGNLGYTYANAARSNDRYKSIADVAAVTTDVITHYPKLSTRPTVRGESAGGWLAVSSVLAKPALFSGAIGYSGMYTFSDFNQTEGPIHFFSVKDDLAQRTAEFKSVCPGVHFRFMHARDDEKLPYKAVTQFAQSVVKSGCEVQLETFDTGGHLIALTPDKAADAMRLMQDYFTAF